MPITIIPAHNIKIIKISGINYFLRQNLITILSTD